MPIYLLISSLSCFFFVLNISFVLPNANFFLSSFNPSRFFHWNSAGRLADIMAGTFLCCVCGFSCSYDCFETRAPFSHHMVFLEKAYLLKDPFVEYEDVICLGSDCTICGKSVCKGNSCSIFFTKRFCIHCFQTVSHAFPEEVRAKVERETKREH